MVADVLFVIFMCLFLQAFAILDLSVDLLFFVDLFFFLQAFAILDLSTDLLFFVDLFLNFITARWIITNTAHILKSDLKKKTRLWTIF